MLDLPVGQPAEAPVAELGIGELREHLARTRPHEHQHPPVVGDVGHGDVEPVARSLHEAVHVAVLGAGARQHVETIRGEPGDRRFANDAAGRSRKRSGDFKAREHAMQQRGAIHRMISRWPDLRLRCDGASAMPQEKIAYRGSDALRRLDQDGMLQPVENDEVGIGQRVGHEPVERHPSAA